jgi:hypothetical protein
MARARTGTLALTLRGGALIFNATIAERYYEQLFRFPTNQDLTK